MFVESYIAEAVDEVDEFTKVVEEGFVGLFGLLHVCDLIE